MPNITEPIFPLPSTIHTLVFDFDGVFTNNKVYISEEGTESVRCDRMDGLGFFIFRRYQEIHQLHINMFILSKESNPVVSVRAKKLAIPCHQNVIEKGKFLRAYFSERSLDPKHAIYVGNDLNDLPAFQVVGTTVAPQDAHPLIKATATHVLKKNGGDGFLREFFETWLRLGELSVQEALTYFEQAH